MSTWRILSWSRDLRRGAIASPHFAQVDFDGAAAEIDDFVVGERVHVELDGPPNAPRVTRIWPDLPRFRARDDAPAAPVLAEPQRTAMESVVRSADGWTDARVVLAADVVRVELDDNRFMYGAGAALDVIGPSYVELPASFAPSFVQLADGNVRAYLATRVELTRDDVALAFIDDERRFFFLVATRFVFTRLRG